MTFYLVGLGLGLDSISSEGKKILEKSDKIFLESYTIDFPYHIEELKESLGIEFEILERKSVEDESILKEAKEKNISLLVYGDPFSATTHHQLILSCKKQKIPLEIYHNASIINSIAETGLSLYKFGKISSMPRWTKNFEPLSFLNYIKENLSVKAHSLLLVDIDFEFSKAIEQLEKALDLEKLKLDKIVLCSRIGTLDKRIFYGTFEELKKMENIKKPFCFIIPSEMHFIEEEFLNSL